MRATDRPTDFSHPRPSRTPQLIPLRLLPASRPPLIAVHPARLHSVADTSDTRYASGATQTDAPQELPIGHYWVILVWVDDLSPVMNGQESDYHSSDDEDYVPDDEEDVDYPSESEVSLQENFSHNVCHLELPYPIFTIVLLS
ncbi:hypothetical protein KIN20_021276 [Parelaphostrongylus tenuis]|uniref:Uncharacterized protein n=1 Tax=Parelaphostrongylus tenuis TaxID=148309 RepID=A0AAD5MSK3_PARTN|nr:hypothetical protein KIN20_021276 [Parelaphostrongylus tenuis]